VNYEPASGDNLDGGKKGWYNHLDSVAAGETQGIAPPEFPGEKAIRNIQLRGGLAFVNSIIPRSSTSCVDIAGGFALAFCPTTGGKDCLEDEGVFDLNDDGAYDKETGGTEEIFGYRFEDTIPADSTFVSDARVTQKVDNTLDIVRTNTGGGLETGRLSWKQQFELK